MNHSSVSMLSSQRGFGLFGYQDKEVMDIVSTEFNESDSTMRVSVLRGTKTIDLFFEVCSKVKLLILTGRLERFQLYDFDDILFEFRIGSDIQALL